jgi:hypothetical protein
MNKENRKVLNSKGTIEKTSLEARETLSAILGLKIKNRNSKNHQQMFRKRFNIYAQYSSP